MPTNQGKQKALAIARRAVSQGVGNLCYEASDCLNKLCCHLGKCMRCQGDVPEVNPSVILTHQATTVVAAEPNKKVASNLPD